MKKKENQFFFIFFGLCWSGFILWNLVTPIKTFSVNENRYLAQLPDFSVQAFVKGQFMVEIDKYINDQFVFRDQWITLKVAMERGLNKQEVNQILFAKNDYLIEHHLTSSIDPNLVDKNVESLDSFIKQQQATNNLHVQVMMVPTASTILKDKLPLFSSNLGFDQTAFIHQITNRLSKELTIDITQVLLEHSQEPIFYKTDHHWTTLGAYYAYEEWANKIGIQPLSQDKFYVEEVTDSFLGTLHSKVNVPINPDSIHLYYLQQAMDYQITYDLSENKSSLYDLSKLTVKDKYAVFLGGNNALIKVNTPLKNKRKLLVIKDSFANAFVPFAVNHFEETIVIDLRYYNGDIDELITNNSVTDVLVLYNVIGFVSDPNVSKLSQ